ncbi:hypothetical protein QM806_27950 [Rhodococcus sp. IEGM 1351]|nr:hypothetical protein [Rhodococcus sp. IEGM 1351]
MTFPDGVGGLTVDNHHSNTNRMRAQEMSVPGARYSRSKSDWEHQISLETRADRTPDPSTGAASRPEVAVSLTDHAPRG